VTTEISYLDNGTHCHKYLWCWLSGRCSLLEAYRGQPEELNINCVDPLNRSALITAIENENIDLIRILLEWKIDVKVHDSTFLV
jgi:hypothetical protein